jgi:outer membrane lipoprotein carrier protein
MVSGQELRPALAGIEKRYNSITTLELDFDQTYSGGIGVQSKRTESGRLFLRKPGLMRWNYAKPQGKLFLSDGKFFYFYSPSTNQMEKTRLKDADDMRVPLAFLIGKLDFNRDFDRFEYSKGPEGLNVKAHPKNLEKSAYREVVFLVDEQFTIKKLTVTGQDSSVMSFQFKNELRNKTQSADLYTMKLPAGAELVEANR